MNYSKEEFLSLYEQWKVLNNKINEALGKNVPGFDLRKERVALEELYSKMHSYAINLIQQNPDNREIACVVYSAFDLRAPMIYEKLSENLRNDKLVTMLAIKKFDESAYGRIGNNLRNDPEVMYLLIKNVQGVNGISQCSQELLGDLAFWREVFESRNVSLASEVGNNFRTVIHSISQLDNNYGLNIDMNLVNEQFNMAMSKESRYSTLDVMGLYNSQWTNSPEIVQKVINGDIEMINKYLPISKLKDELLVGKDFTEEQNVAIRR